MKDEELTRVNVIKAQGTPSGLVTQIVERLVQFGGGETLLAWGGQDNNIITGARYGRMSFPGAVNLSIPPGQISEGYGYGSNETRTNARQKDWMPQIVVANDALVGAVRRSGIDSPFCLYFGTVGGHFPRVIADLQDMRNRLPGMATMAAVAMPHEFSLKGKLAENPWFAQSLHEAGLVKTTVIFANDSRIALNHGRPFQDSLFATGMAGLMASIAQFRNMKGPLDVAEHLCKYPLLGMSVGLEGIPVARENSRVHVLYRRVAGGMAHGVVSPEDVIHQTITACRTAIFDMEWRTVEDAPNAGVLAYMVIVLPLPMRKRRDQEVWRVVRAAVEQWLANAHPWITALWVSGPGVVHPEYVRRTPYNLVVNLLYPLPEKPKAILRLQRRDGVAEAALGTPVVRTGRNGSKPLELVNSSGEKEVA